MRFGIVVFPGSNCDLDTKWAVGNVLGAEAVWLWHKEQSIDGVDAVVLPGGFSYGDYLRTGAIARFSPIMKAVTDFAKGGRPVIGICNGFQILVESHLLPGALVTNDSLRFRSEMVRVRVERSDTVFTGTLNEGDVLRMPIAHACGNYYAGEETLKELEENGQVAFRYCTEEGEVTADSNPNGSLQNIAGIYNSEGNVLGLMPHPERASEALLGSADGLGIFRSICEAI